MNLPSISAFAGGLLALALHAAAADAVTYFSFESDTQGWAVNGADWANGFSAVAVADGHATDGTKSLQIDFTGQSYRWGAVRENLNHPGFLGAIKNGGKLFLDLHVPEASAGIQNLGFVIQQPDVQGDAGWQQVWFAVGGQTGDFTIELPFTRAGSGAVNLHLGQNAAVDQPFTIFVDNLRVESAPPPGGGADPVLVQSFEDSTTHGWALNTADWANGFATLENSAERATQGTKAMKITFTGQSYRWGAVNAGLTDQTFTQAIQYGGRLLVDLVIPDDSTGVQNIGLSFQQPDVEGALNWQQVWFGTGGQTGTFTIDLPFVRTGTAPVTLHLGQNATVDQPCTIYLDNVRVVPNAPPPSNAVTITRVYPLFSFEDDTTEGFEPNAEGWANAFTLVENAAANATDGTKSLKTTFAPANWQWGGYARGITRPDILSAISRGGTLLVDVFIPETSTGIQNLGVVLGQPGVAQPNDWQQVWFPVGGATGRFTIDLPFNRHASGSVVIHLGRNATGETEQEVYYDNFRVVVAEQVGGAPGSVDIGLNAEGKVRVDFTGGLQSADSLTGTFADQPGASPLVLDATAGTRFFRATSQTVEFFSDTFDGADKGWTKPTLPGDSGLTTWQAGTPEFPDEVTFAHSGDKCWTTGLNTTYGDGSVIALVSPVIDLAGNNDARLSFYSLVDVGGQAGDADKVEVFVRNEAGAALTGAEAAIWTKSRTGTAPWFFQHEVVDLPDVATGKKVKLEFRLTTDAVPNLQKGWMIDTVSVYARP